MNIQIKIIFLQPIRLTEVSRIVCLRTSQADGLHVRDYVLPLALVNALPVSNNVHMIEHLENLCAWCVDGANDRSTPVR